MSTSLYWAPPPAVVKDHDVDLKWEIGKFYDPEYNGETIDRECGNGLIPFLRGIVVASIDKEKIKSAKELISAIEKYGSVQLYTK